MCCARPSFFSDDGHFAACDSSWMRVFISVRAEPGSETASCAIVHVGGLYFEALLGKILNKS